MHMKFEYTVIDREEDDGFSIWFNGDVTPSESDILEVLKPLKIASKKTIYVSFGPTECIDEYLTNFGKFNLSQEMDEFSGVGIYSTRKELMKRILTLIQSSNLFTERLEKSI